MPIEKYGKTQNSSGRQHFLAFYSYLRTLMKLVKLFGSWCWPNCLQWLLVAGLEKSTRPLILRRHCPLKLTRHCPLIFMRHCPLIFKRHCPLIFKRHCPLIFKRHCPLIFKRHCPLIFKRHCPLIFTCASDFRERENLDDFQCKLNLFHRYINYGQVLVLRIFWTDNTSCH